MSQPQDSSVKETMGIFLNRELSDNAVLFSENIIRFSELSDYSLFKNSPVVSPKRDFSFTRPPFMDPFMDQR